MTDFSSVPQLFLSSSTVRGRTKQSSIPQSWECLLFGELSEEEFPTSDASSVRMAVLP